MRWSVLLIVVSIHFEIAAQVPFVSLEDRFMIFSRERFEKLEARPPKRVFPMEDQVVYEDHSGSLKIFLSEGRKLYMLQKEDAGKVRASRRAIAWLATDTLKRWHNGRIEVIATGITDLSITDEILAFRNGDSLTMLRATDTTRVLLNTENDTSRSWSTRNDMILFHDEAGDLQMFHEGVIHHLADSPDPKMIVAGRNVAAWWNEADGLAIWYRGQIIRPTLERPAILQAANELVVFSLPLGGTRCFFRGSFHDVSKQTLHGIWATDDLLVYIEDGEMKIFHPNGALDVEPYIPEWWDISGDMLAYMDINRKLKGIDNGERIRFGNEANAMDPELFGEALLYLSPTGNFTIISKGKTYIF